MGFGNGEMPRIGAITLHGLIYEKYGYNGRSIAATLSGSLLVCAGEAALAKFAESYFRNEQKAETPFTSAGAKELLRLGILTIAVQPAARWQEVLQRGFLQVLCRWKTR